MKLLVVGGLLTAGVVIAGSITFGLMQNKGTGPEQVAQNEPQTLVTNETNGANDTLLAALGDGADAARLSPATAAGSASGSADGAQAGQADDPLLAALADGADAGSVSPATAAGGPVDGVGQPFDGVGGDGNGGGDPSASSN